MLSSAIMNVESHIKRVDLTKAEALYTARNKNVIIYEEIGTTGKELE